MQLRDFDQGQFLAEYWQQKPMLFRAAWQDWSNPISPSELAGLALEEHVESRLVAQTEENLRVENGPLDESRFGDLGRKNWTLLVQAVDHYIPEVAALIDPFRFIPNWRIDDVMVSYASDGGGVGAHFDHYDVFLIQGLGKRRWQIGGMCDDNTELMPHDDLRLLANFEVAEEWVLEPGDMLYVPPGLSHNGVAVGDDCMTYSVGFRAPSRSELIGHWMDDLLADARDDDRYGDARLALQGNPGEIKSEAIERLHAMVLEKIADREAFAGWFGQYNSTRKYSEIDWSPDDEVDADQIEGFLSRGLILQRNPASRFSYIDKGEDTLVFFCDGEMFNCSGDAAVLARQIGGAGAISIVARARKSDQLLSLVAALYNQGSLSFEPE